jgi:hypothetical protein
MGLFGLIISHYFNLMFDPQSPGAEQWFGADTGVRSARGYRGGTIPNHKRDACYPVAPAKNDPANLGVLSARLPYRSALESRRDLDTLPLIPDRVKFILGTGVHLKSCRDLTRPPAVGVPWDNMLSEDHSTGAPSRRHFQ